jgi:hypothetical protein
MMVLAQAPVVVVPVLEGVTTAIVAFIFVCVVYPHLVKHKTQFYAAFTAVLVIILLHSLNVMIGSVGFQVFAGFLTGVLQVGAIVLLFMAAGGVTLREIGGEMARAYEVIRRGEEEKTVIIPLTGERPKPRQQPGSRAPVAVDDDDDDGPVGEKIDLPPNAGWPTRPDDRKSGDSSIPLE